MVQNMTQGSPIRHILTFMIPLLIGNVFQQLYNIADVIIVGRTIGVHALAAVGATAPIFMLFFGLAIGITSGFSVITGQKFGAGDTEGVRRSAAMSAMLSLLFTILLTFMAALFLPSMLRLMNVPEELFTDSFHYISIVAYGIFAMVLYNLLACIIRSLGDSRTPLYFLILSSIINIVLALFFIRSLGWGVPGSAIALVIAQGVSALLCLLYIRLRFPILHLKRSDWQWNTDFALTHLRIGIPMAIQFTIICLGIIIIQSVCNTFGAETIAGFISATRLEQLAIQPMISFGIAMAVYTAQNYGARRYDRIRAGVRKCSLLSLLFCAAAALAMHFGGQHMILLFIDEYNDAVMTAAMQYLWHSVPFYFFLGQIFIYRNVMQGMGIAAVPLISSLLELLLRGGAAFILAASLGYIGICYASPICWVAASLFTSGSYFCVMRGIKKKESIPSTK